MRCKIYQNKKMDIEVEFDKEIVLPIGEKIISVSMPIEEALCHFDYNLLEKVLMDEEEVYIDLSKEEIEKLIR